MFDILGLQAVNVWNNKVLKEVSDYIKNTATFLTWMKIITGKLNNQFSDTRLTMHPYGQSTLGSNIRLKTLIVSGTKQVISKIYLLVLAVWLSLECITLQHSMQHLQHRLLHVFVFRSIQQQNRCLKKFR